MAQELIVSVTGGYNGGATISMTLDGSPVFTSTAPDTYNQNYNNRSGTFQTQAGEVAVSITPPPTSSSALTIILAGAVTDSLSIMPNGSNTSYGYSYSTSYEIGGEPPLPPGFYDTGLGWGAMSDWLLESGNLKLGELGKYKWPNADYALPVPRTGSGAADIYANGMLVATYTSTMDGHNKEVYMGADNINTFLYSNTTSGSHNFISAVSPEPGGKVFSAIKDLDTGTVTADRTLITQSLVGIYDGVNWYYDEFGFVMPYITSPVWYVPRTTKEIAASTPISISTPIYKLNPGWAVSAIIRWRDTVKTYHTPILISSIESATKLSLDGNTEYYNSYTSIHQYDGMSFYVTVISDDLGVTTESLTHTADFNDTIYTISGVFRRLAGSSYSGLKVLSAPDPYEDQTGSSEIGGGDGEEVEDDDVDFTTPPASMAVASGFVTLFCPSQAELNSLASFMWSSAFDFNSFIKLFANPMDCIIGLSVFPFPVIASGQKEVKVGGVSTQVTMGYTTNQYWPVDCGTLTIPKQWGAYMDYAPYTKFNIWLPYIGFRPISADDVMGKTLELRYLVDIFSGACNAELKCGSTILYSWAGNCAQQIPITGTNWQSAYAAALSIAAGVATVASGGATAPMIAGTVASATVNSMQLKPEVQRSGSVSGSSGFVACQKPYIVRTNPRSAIPASQNKFHGYPSFVTVNLGQISGYNEVYSIHLENIPATGAELDEIESILKGGAIF